MRVQAPAGVRAEVFAWAPGRLCVGSVSALQELVQAQKNPTRRIQSHKDAPGGVNLSRGARSP